MVRYRVAHDFTVVHVQYWRQVALVHADVYLRHVGSPLLIGSGRGEVAVHYVRGRLADLALVRTVLVPFADILQKFLPHDPADGLVVDSEAFVPELRIDSAVAVTAPVLCVYRPYPFTFFRIAVGPLAQVVVVCGAGQSACLQEMFKRVLAAQFSDDLGPIPNISAFTSWSRAFNFFR